MSIAMSSVLASTFVSSASAAPAPVSVAGEASATSEALCEKDGAKVTADAAAVPVVAHKKDIPADFELTSPNAVGGTVNPNFVLNPCAEIDLSQIVDCRSGTCYEYCWNRIQPYSRVYCAEDKKYYSRKNWIRYVSGHRGNDCVPGSRPA